MTKRHVQQTVTKDDVKYLALIIGGSLLVSVLTIAVGSFLRGTGESFLIPMGHGVASFGWLWVIGSIGAAFFVLAQMRSLQLQAIRVESHE